MQQIVGRDLGQQAFRAFEPFELALARSPKPNCAFVADAFGNDVFHAFKCAATDK